MPRYRISRKVSKVEDGLQRREFMECTDDEASIFAESVSYSRKETNAAVVANPELIPQPYHCGNWLPKFVYLDSGRKKDVPDDESNDDTEIEIKGQPNLLAKKKFICENLRGYYIPKEEGKYGMPYWAALEQSSAETNVGEILLEEIALEGLDGITLQALWERLKARFRRSEICLNSQNYFWEVIRKIPCIIFYQLSEARNNLQPLYRENYLDERGNPFQPAWAPEEIYSYEPIVDKKKKVRGSCSMYKKRKCKSKYFSAKTFEEILKFGNRMVMVAPQHVRENALCVEDHEEEYPLTVAQYCMLERIGRARREGEQTKGNVSLTAMKLENKSSFHYRRDLLELGVITRQTYAMKFASSRTTSWISVFHLPRYFTPFETVPVKNVKRVILELRTNPRHFEEYSNVLKNYGKQTMKFIIDPLISHILQVKEDSQATLFPQLYENVKAESKKAIFRKRMIKIVSLSEAQVSEGEIDILLREIQENHVPKNERIVEEYDEENDQDSDDNVISEDETMLYKLFVYLHESGGLGVTLEEVAVYFSIGKLDARTAIRSVQRKKCLNSYWEGKGKTKCRRYFLSKFAHVNQQLCDAASASVVPASTSSERSTTLPKSVSKLLGQDDNEPEINANFVVINLQDRDNNQFNTETVDSYTFDETCTPINMTREAEEMDETPVRSTLHVNIGNTIRGNIAVCKKEIMINDGFVPNDTQSENDEICPGETFEIVTESMEIQNLHDRPELDSFNGIALHSQVIESAGENTGFLKAIPISIDKPSEAPMPFLGQVENAPKIVKGKKRRADAAESVDNEISVPPPPRKKKQMYDEIDRAAIQKRKKQRVEWSAEEDHCILIIFVASVVFIPNYVLGKTFVFNAPQIRDLLHKNIRDSANKTQTAVRRRLHFLMKQRKFNARYRYYLSATFSDDRVFKFVERHINQFKKPGRGFLEISVSALSAVYTYIMTHFVGINAFNEEDENFIDAPSFGQLTALRSYRRSEISEEFLNAEDDLTGDNAEAPNADTIRQKEQKKEWSLKMCQMKARQIHPNPEDCLHTINCLLSNYLSLYESEACEKMVGNDNHEWDKPINRKKRNPRILSQSTSYNSEEVGEIHSWRTDRKKTYWERNIVLGTNEPRNISEILIWQIRTVIIRILLTAKHAASIKNYLSKLPEYYLDYIVYSLREMEIASHSKRGKNVRLALLATLYRGPYPNDYYMAHSLDSRCAPGAMILMDDRTRCGTFLCIIEWMMRNVSMFHFEYSDVVVGVKADWKDVFQLLISEEFGFKMYMKKSQKRLQLLRNIIFDEDIDESERAQCLIEFVHSINLPTLSDDIVDDSKYSRLARLDNFRRKLEYLSKILAKFRRRKNKQVDWGVYLKRERDVMKAKQEGKPLSKMMKYSGIEFEESDEDEESDENDNSPLRITKIVRDKFVGCKEYGDESGHKNVANKNVNEDEEEGSDCEEDLHEEFANNIKINFNELVSAKDSSPELKAMLNKINVNLAAGTTTFYYSDEINKVIDGRLEDIKVEEESIHEELKELDCDISTPDKLNYKNKIHPANYDEVEMLGNRLGSFSMANEFLTMEEPTIFVRHEVPQSADLFQKEYDFSHFTPLTKECLEIKFVRCRLLPIVLEKDMIMIDGLGSCLASQNENPIEIESQKGVNNLSASLGCYYELFKMIRITEEIGVSLELLKTLFSRDYLKDGLEDLMEKKLIFLVGVHNRKFISVEFIHSWSLPVKLKNSKFLNLKTSRRYVVHPWITSGGKVEWKLVIKLFTIILSYMDTVSVTVDDLCCSMVPILSVVETLLLVECLVKLNVVTLYKFKDCGKTTLWSKPSVSHYISRLQDFDSFLDLENLSVKLGPKYFKRFCDVQMLLRSMNFT